MSQYSPISTLLYNLSILFLVNASIHHLSVTPLTQWMLSAQYRCQCCPSASQLTQWIANVIFYCDPSLPTSHAKLSPKWVLVLAGSPLLCFTTVFSLMYLGHLPCSFF